MGGGVIGHGPLWVGSSARCDPPVRRMRSEAGEHLHAGDHESVRRGVVCHLAVLSGRSSVVGSLPRVPHPCPRSRANAWHLPTNCSVTCCPSRLRNGNGPALPGARPASCSRRSSVSPAPLAQRSGRHAFRARKAAAPRAAVPGTGLHTRRHSAASVMLAHGVPLEVVSEILGHSSIAMTGDVYGHVAPDVLREAVDTPRRRSRLVRVS